MKSTELLNTKVIHKMLGEGIITEAGDNYVSVKFASKVEAENLQIVNLVKAVKLSTPQLTVLLSAYAKGDVLLPDEYEEELKAIEENEQQEDGTNEE